MRIKLNLIKKNFQFEIGVQCNSKKVKLKSKKYIIKLEMSTSDARCLQKIIILSTMQLLIK